MENNFLKEQKSRIASLYTEQAHKNELEKAKEFFEKGGKRAFEGEEREFGGRTYVRQKDGWKYSRKNTTKAVEKKETKVDLSHKDYKPDSVEQLGKDVKEAYKKSPLHIQKQKIKEYTDKHFPDKGNKSQDENLEKFFSKFPDDAKKWDQATDEIRDIAQIAKEYYNEIDLNLLKEDPKAHPALEFREIKSPSEWNTKGKQYIRDVVSKMSPNTKKAFMDRISSFLKSNR